MSGTPRVALGIVAKLGRPILDILGVKRGSVAGKVDQAVEAVDSVIPPETKSGPPPSGP